MFHLDDDIKVSIELGAYDLEDIAERGQEYGFLRYMEEAKKCYYDTHCTDQDYIGYRFYRSKEPTHHNDNANLFILPRPNGLVLYVDTWTFRCYNNACLKEKESLRA
ncbi:hypothetical protein NVP2275O_336 [Vibrio phage 2.275.O._10N.286.54.E11]|nr:hypothetical protein NVP2275O_336 [Vibrio phage 2.275.O._10N.286.54.E11]